MSTKKHITFTAECGRCYRSLDKTFRSRKAAKEAMAAAGWRKRYVSGAKEWRCNRCSAKPEWDDEDRLRAIYGLSELELADLVAGDPAVVARMVRERPRLKLCVEELEGLLNA